MWRMKDSEAVLFIAVVTPMQPCGEGRGQRVPKPATGRRSRSGLRGRISCHGHRQRERDDYESHSRGIRHEPHLVPLTLIGPHTDRIRPVS
jgi:hypothetical protein